MSDDVIHYTAQRTESMDRLSAELESLIDSAVQVSDVLDDVSSRASQLDAKSDDRLDVISDSTRLDAVLNALCTHQPRYARFLWSAAHNLVRDVIGHVTSGDRGPRVKVAENATDLDNGRRQRRRVAAELDLFHGNDAHLACKTTRYG